MRYAPFIAMLLGGVLLLVPLDRVRDVVVPEADVLDVAYKADKASKIAILGQLSRMDSDAETRSKAFAELDKKEFSKNFSAWGDAVARAIHDHKESDLVKVLEK